MEGLHAGEHEAVGPRPSVPGIGPGADPVARLEAEERPWGAGEKFSEEASRALAEELSRSVEGEVRFDRMTRAAYSTDGSNYRQVPIGVVCPRTPEDVVAALAVCRRHGAPVLGRGGGTSLAGQCCNVAVVFDFTKYMHRVLEVNPSAKLARVEPGCVLDVLRNEAERHHLTFGPDPSTHMNCTLGGMIGNNSCGMHAQMAGPTSHNVRRLEIVTYDGLRTWVGPTSESELDLLVRGNDRRAEIYRRLVQIRDRYGEEVRRRYPKIPRRISGYNLDQLLPEHGFQVARALVGTESTCALVLQAELDLVPSPPVRILLVLGYPDVYHAGDDVPEIDRFHPLALEGLDHVLIEDMETKHVHTRQLGLLPEGRGFLMVEFGGWDEAEAHENARRCMDALRRRASPPSMKLVTERAHMEQLWLVRESGLSATARIPGKPDSWEGWEDSAVPPERLGEYLRALRKLFDKYGYGCALYGHFGQACVHTRIDWDPTTREGIAKWMSFMDEATSLCVSMGGSLSGEHGDGQSRAQFLGKMFGEDLLEAFREFKRTWDPEWKMNPGKVVDPYRVDENLRLGDGFVEVRPRTHFKLKDDDGSFGRAALRCVGVGKCRRVDSEQGVMCPSYMVTREEVHATRGRARLLFEMTMGDPVKTGWRSKEVHEALHLCLACKGCKSDCPMNVDMATYKAEFYAHYYAGRLRPRAAYAMGLVMWWARLASLAPRVVNALTHAPGLSSAFKWAGGMAPERQVPRFAPYTFRRWFRTHRPAHPQGDRVMLFTDTFNDHFHPETAIAAVDVLEAAGYRVEIPEAHVCCGRPLYDFGMLDLAKRMLLRDLRVLRPVVEEGVPMIVLEPSCAAVFRDELPGLLGDEGAAKALRERTRVLSEFVAEHLDRFPLGRVSRKALVQPHCHQHAVIGMDAERKVLERLGLDCEDPKAGCCGMAGSFGFEAGDTYRVSVAAGERVLLPKVRALPSDALVIANGFSCRTQIQQGAGRRALHLAEVMRLAMQPGAARRIRRGKRPALPARARLARAAPRVAMALGVAALVTVALRR